MTTGLAGAVLISPGRSFGDLPSGISRAEVVQRMEDNLENTHGMHTVGDATAEDLADEVIRNNALEPCAVRPPLTPRIT